MHLTTPAVNVRFVTLIPTITIAQAVIQVIVLMVIPTQPLKVLMVIPTQPLKSALVAQDQVLVTNAIQIRIAMYLLNIAHTDARLTTLVTNAFLVNPLPNLLKKNGNGGFILMKVHLLVGKTNLIQTAVKKVNICVYITLPIIV